jgi:hypothetical protein
MNDKKFRAAKIDMQISIWIVHVCDDFGVARAFQRVKAETSFPNELHGLESPCHFGCGCRGRT